MYIYTHDVICLRIRSSHRPSPIGVTNFLSQFFGLGGRPKMGRWLATKPWETMYIVCIIIDNMMSNMIFTYIYICT